MAKQATSGGIAASVAPLDAAPIPVSNLLAESMIIAVCILTGVLLTELFAANKAPLGFQDDTGFHFGHPDAVASAPSQIWRAK